MEGKYFSFAPRANPPIVNSCPVQVVGLTHAYTGSVTPNKTHLTIQATAHVPSVEESGLGRPEYDEVVANGVPDLANPSPFKGKRVTRGEYTVYTAESQAKIGKYASENGTLACGMNMYDHKQVYQIFVVSLDHEMLKHRF